MRYYPGPLNRFTAKFIGCVQSHWEASAIKPATVCRFGIQFEGIRSFSKATP